MKKKILFRGTATALVTPFQDGEIDYEALGGIIEMQISGGVEALVVGGTTGEAATLSDKERYELYEFALKKIDGRVKVILGTGTNDTRIAEKHTKFASSLSPDGVLAVTPYYNKGTESGVVSHYLHIADVSRVGVILYNVPSRTGVNLTLNTLEELSRHENIVAIKEASDSTDRLVELSRFGESLSLYAGNDSQIYPTLALGGLGVISVASNLYPCQISEIARLYFAGRHEESLLAQQNALPLIHALFMETNPTPVKYAMHLLGLCSPEMRLPLSLPTFVTRRRLEDLIVRSPSSPK